MSFLGGHVKSFLFSCHLEQGEAPAFAVLQTLAPPGHHTCFPGSLLQPHSPQDSCRDGTALLQSISEQVLSRAQGVSAAQWAGKGEIGGTFEILTAQIFPCFATLSFTSPCIQLIRQRCNNRLPTAEGM